MKSNKNDRKKIITKNNNLFNGYLEHIENQYKNNTKIAYEHHVRIFIRWVNINEYSLKNINIQNIIDFCKSNYGKSSKNKFYIALSSVKNFIYYLNLFEHNTTLDYNLIKLPKIPKNDLNLPSPASFKELLNICTLNLEISVIVYLAAFYCIRLEEIINIKIDDIDFDNNVIHLYTKRIVYLTDEMANMLKIKCKIQTSRDRKMLTDIANRQMFWKVFEKEIKPHMKCKDKITLKMLNNWGRYQYIKKDVSIIELATYLNVTTVTIENFVNSCMMLDVKKLIQKEK